MLLADRTMRELVEVFGTPQVRPEDMTDEEFYDWLDGDMADVGERWDEAEARAVGSKCYGEI